MLQSQPVDTAPEDSELTKLQEELTLLAVDLIERDLEIASFRAALEGVLMLPCGQLRAAIESIHGKVVESLEHRDGWKPFERRLGAAHQDFLTRLSARFPTLTMAEIRICSMLRSILKTRDIAQLLGTSTRNIETHRYWIRRKLALDRTQDLVTFLAGI